MASSSVARLLFVGAFVVCCLISLVFGATITVTFTGGAAYVGTASANCPYVMTVTNDYIFNSNSATVACAISGTANSVTFGSGGTANTYSNSLAFTQSGGSLTVASGQSVTHLTVSYTGNAAVNIAGNLIAQSHAITSNNAQVAATGSIQSTAAAGVTLTAVAGGNPINIAGTVSATGGPVSIVNFVVTTVTGSQISSNNNVVINPWGTSNLVAPISSSGGNIQITPNTGASLALTVSGTLTNTFASGNILIGAAADTTSVAVSGTVTLNGGSLTVNTAAGTATFSSAISGASSITLPTTGTVTIAAAGTFGFTGAFTAATTGTFSHAGQIVGTATSTIDINTSGSTTITGVVQSLNPTIGSNVFRIRPSGTPVSFSGATITTAGEVLIGNTGATTYALSSSTINFANRFTLSNPTTFATSTFVTPNWNVQVSGGSAVAGPSGTALPYTFLASSNAITSALFPSGINTNCIWVQAPAATTSFAVTLPNAIQYRNYVQASPNALVVSSTNGGAVTRCAPLLTSVLDRRNDIFKANLVYFGGNAVFYFVTSAALPFGTITASDFTISGGSITSVTSLGGSPTAFAITVSLTCDGVVSLSYNGSITGNGGNFLGISASSADRVVNAKCIANIYAPCG